MVARTEQARWHGDRWFGHALTLSLTIPGSGFITRRIHQEEARAIIVTVGGNSSGLAALLPPIDCRRMTLGGPYFTVWNDSASVANLLLSDGSISFATIVPGKSAQAYLVSNSTEAGTWMGLDLNSTGVTSGARTFLT